MDDFEPTTYLHAPNASAIPSNPNHGHAPPYSVDQSYDAIAGHIHNLLQHHYDAVLSHYIETVAGGGKQQPPPPPPTQPPVVPHSTADLRRLQKEHQSLHRMTHSALGRMTSVLDSATIHTKRRGKQ